MNISIICRIRIFCCPHISPKTNDFFFSVVHDEFKNGFSSLLSKVRNQFFVASFVMFREVGNFGRYLKSFLSRTMPNTEYGMLNNTNSQCYISPFRIVIYKALCFDVAQGRMNGAPNETRTHSGRFASQGC